jgi:hypothetical protein
MRATCMSGFRRRERGDGTEAAKLLRLFPTRHLPMSREQANLFFRSHSERKGRSLYHHYVQVLRIR